MMKAKSTVKAKVKVEAKAKPKVKAKKPRPMRHITRVDYERKHQHGWWVRIHRDGKMIQQFFSDIKYQSRAAALRAAKDYRAELLIKYPKPEHGNMFNRLRRHNRSGVAGVHRTITHKDGRLYTVWQTAWLLPDGKRIVKKFAFSLKNRSEQEAKDLAIAAREAGLKHVAKLRRQLRKQEREQND